MIKAIRLINIGPHKNTYLEFDKGLNSLIGSSATGKSTVIKAMDLMMNNYRSDLGYISHFAKTEKTKRNGETEKVILENSEIHIYTDKGIVKKVKGDKDNYYQINDSDPLKNFGKNGVPKDVTDFLNLSEINIQRQKDPYFVLNITAGEVAKILNKAVDIQLIDDTIASIESEVRRTNNAIRGCEYSIEEEKEKLEDLPNISELEKELSLLEQEDKDLFKTEIDIENVSKAIQTLEAQKTLSVFLSEKVSAENEVLLLKEMEETILNDQKKIDEGNASIVSIQKLMVSKTDKEVICSFEKEANSLLNDYNKLKDMSDSISYGKQSISTINELAEKRTQVENIASIDYEYLMKKKEMLGIRKDNIQKVKDAIENISLLVRKKRRTETRIQKLEEELHDNLKDAVCPLCHRGPDGKEHIMDSEGKEITF